MLTDKYLQEIEARHKAATPGPWNVVPLFRRRGPNSIVVCAEGDWDICETFEIDAYSVDNMEFIAYSRADIPALLDEVKRLRAENERVAGTCTWKYDDMYDYYDTDCGFAWQSGVGGRLEEHGVEYCHKCGRRIVVKMPEYQEEESDETN
jgi:hypothetical protein